MNKLTIRRIGAYLIDYIFIVLFLTMLNQIRFLNPTYDEYVKTYDSYMEIYNELTVDNSLDIIKSEEFQKINYDLSRYSISMSIISLIVYLAYFVGFQKWNNNQTLGKKMFNIQVASKDDQNVKWWQMLVRYLIVYNIGIEILLIICLLLFEYKSYLIISVALNLLASVIFYIVVFMIILRKDGRGLHDLIAGTKIVAKN